MAESAWKNAMTKTTFEICCEHCKTWFRSPINLGSLKSFDAARIWGNRVGCPKCKQMTGCNKENTRVRGDNEGFLGEKT
jgi:hypothetical protein